MSEGGTRISEWFDLAEASLESAARQAGLLEHSTMVGSAREFLVKRLLKSILPPIVHIGSGKVIDAKGHSSREVDIVLCDSRFPIFEIVEGNGLYPIEGVIATIEVKSTLTETKLRDALDNGRSVLQLTPHVELEPSHSAWIERLVKSKNKARISTEEAVRIEGFATIPATYVFALRSKMKQRALATQLDAWFTEKEEPTVCHRQCAVLPRIVIAGRTLGVLDDGYCRIEADEEVRRECDDTHGPGMKVLMVCFETQWRFGWLASHLLHTVANRLGLRHEGSKMRYTIEQYLRAIDYFDRERRDRKKLRKPWLEFIVWRRHAMK